MQASVVPIAMARANRVTARHIRGGMRPCLKKMLAEGSDARKTPGAGASGLSVGRRSIGIAKLALSAERLSFILFTPEEEKPLRATSSSRIKPRVGSPSNPWHSPNGPRGRHRTVWKEDNAILVARGNLVFWPSIQDFN
jgi:hypothetical protein